LVGSAGVIAAEMRGAVSASSLDMKSSPYIIGVIVIVGAVLAFVF
jgi:hypothetical protein